ncbi:MAG: PDZ domain-containing protein [Candidatus Obscuribacter sp.]|nr:PDZ domain-containing protein [Candidatus Obscuribacter sp.]
MKYGPDLPRDPRPIAVIGRALQVIGLGALASFLFTVALSLYLVFPLTDLSPKDLYHTAWQSARDYSYDPKALKDWSIAEHEHDADIKSQDDAVKYINEAFKASGDHYAVLLDPKQAGQERSRMQGEFAGIGISVAPKFDDKGALVFGADKSKGPLMDHDDDGNVKIELIEGGPASKAGVKSGDVVKALNGKPVKGITTEEFVNTARGTIGTELIMTVVRNGTPLDIKVTRGIVQTKAVSSKMLTAANGTKVGYIRLESFIQQTTPKEMYDALGSLKGADRIILDLRFNPGGDVQVCVQLMSMFIEKGTLVSIRERRPGAGHAKMTYAADGNNITVTTVDEASGTTEVQSFKRPPARGLNQNLIVLVNKQSASASEMFTGAVKDHNRAIVVGEKTFGKGIGQTVMPMPNGTVMHITSLRYFTPNGTWLGDGGNGSEQFGVEPHNVIKLDESPTTRLGDPKHDNQLSFALDLISQ